MQSDAGRRGFGKKRMLSLAVLLAAAFLVVFGVLDAVQSRAASQDTSKARHSFEFEVASIKPNKVGNNMIRIMFSPNGFEGTNATLQMLVKIAYGIDDNQISGGPNWLSTDHFDINAKMDSATADALHKLTEDEAKPERQHMLQVLLADRFKLTFHRETKELSIYKLVVAKNGPKLQEAKPGDTYPNGIKGPDGIGRPGVMRMGRGEVTGQGLPVSAFARLLTQQLGRTVIDKTGLTAKYDFTLKWTPDESEAAMFRGADPGPQGSTSTTSADSSGPSIFTAIQEQLGLRLEAQKGPVEILVIDHAEQPSEN